MPNYVSIKAHCATIINYARFQNGMKIVNRVVVKNTSGKLLNGVEMSIESNPGVIHRYNQYVGEICPGKSVVIDDIRVDIDTEYLANLTELQFGVLRITITARDEDFTPVTSSCDMTILPYDQWEGVKKTDELLASFCVPNHPDVKLIVQAASDKMHDWTGDSSMDGYDSEDISRVKMQAAAIFEAIKEKCVSYALPMATFYESGQRIRMPEEILSTGLATCIDSALLYASCLESIGLRPLIILNSTHAYVGLWLDGEVTSPCVINDDPALLRKRNAEGINQMLPVETTCMDRDLSCSFDDAVKKAEKFLSDISVFECYVDIHEARKLGVNPLPLRVRTAAGYEIIPPEKKEQEECPEALPSTDAIDLSSPALVDKQTIWERKLLDLTNRNNLLNIHPRSILQLMNPDEQTLVKLVENGRSIRVCASPEGWEGMKHDCGIYANLAPSDKMAVFANAEIRDGKVHTFLDLNTSTSRVDSLRLAAKRSIDENGANPLYLAAGALKWIDEEKKKEHFAPILLIPCEIVPPVNSVVATGEEAVFNLTLLEMLRENFGITIPGFDELPEKNGHTDVRLIFNTVRKAVMDKKGWDVEPLVFLGNFTFNKFVIWNDLHTGHETFDANPVVSSFKAGVLDSKVEPISETADDIDETCPPQRILLPIEADSSQIKAIRDALDGRTFVMQGPPGTGKSQTITNIIANALYYGKRVLFVSEKKAALEVVQKRLDAIGLSPYCLELHSNKARKSVVLEKIAATLKVKEPEFARTFESDVQSVTDFRSSLDSHVKKLHFADDSGMTLYEALSNYLAADVSVPFRNMPNSIMTSLNQDSIRRMQSCIRDFAAAAGHVSVDEIRELLDLPLKEYTPALAETLTAEMKKLLSTGNPLLFRLRSRNLPKILGFDIWKMLELKRNAERRAKVRLWHDSLDKLRDYAIYNSRRVLLRSLGLGSFASDYEKGGVEVTEMHKFLMKSLHYSFAKNKISVDSNLSMFSGDLFENSIKDYRTAESSFRQSSRKAICRKLYANIEELKHISDSFQVALLNKAISNGGRGTTLRKLFAAIPDVMPKVCPCMLMSPLSVSQYFMAQKDLFDIVIFDEASQLQTCEAIGSIGRGKSLIVAGDSKQLPPTTFFETLSFDADNADREDMESVLEDCVSLSVPSNLLKWHYRSRHESLIAFSNSKYYDNNLLTFPSTDDLTNKVTLQHVAGEYERGGTRQNKKEAEAVVAEIKRRLEKEPDKSIGVITFSLPQQNAVEKRLETMLRNNPGLEQIASAMSEPIFVKNLESVQGDERDVILFSVGYGRDKFGRIPMNFGPLNQKGGWRRLNVAVSRARYEMKVFSSLDPEDIRVDYNTPKGVVGLRDFLRYAIEGRSCLEERYDENTVHDEWVEKLADDLRKQGLSVDTNVGASDFHIDIAVRDPEKEGCYSCGVMCDGVNYASSQSAIDREIVRPAVLEGLGWKIVRKWIMDDYIADEQKKNR